MGCSRPKHGGKKNCHTSTVFTDWAAAASLGFGPTTESQNTPEKFVQSFLATENSPQAIILPLALRKAVGHPYFKRELLVSS